PDSGELPGQRHHRPAHRELRVLAGCEGRSRTAARRHAVELGDAALGGLSNGARDLVGDPVSLRPDGMDTAHLGTVPRRGTVNRVGPLVGVLIAVLSASPTVRLCGQDTTAGKKVYEKCCAGCHGDTGAGDGPAAAHMLPRPRNFTGAVYKIRTTASGQLPTDADLMRAIDEGLPGSAMPAWKGRLSDAERRDVMAYLKTFSSFFADTSQHVAALKFSSAPAGGTDPSALKEGRRFYEDSIHCNKCHGDQGRGDGPSAPTLKDDAAWARVDRYWFPLVGQVIRKLRWFAPAVSGVWVQAVHDGKAVAVRVSWDDRSQSPDTAWLGFERRVRETVAGDDSGASAETGRWPDQLAVQFPRRIPEGMER